MNYTEYCGTFLETNAHARINSGPVLGTFYLRVGTMWVNVSSSSCPIGAWNAWYEYEISNKGIMSIYDTHMKISEESWTFITNGYI